MNNDLWLSLWTAEVSSSVKRVIAYQRLNLGRSIQDAEDAYSHAMFTSWQRVEAFNPRKASFATWVAGIAKTYMLKRQNREETIEPYKVAQMTAVEFARHRRTNSVHRVRLSQSAKPSRSKKRQAVYEWLKSKDGWVTLGEYVEYCKSIGFMCSKGYTLNQKWSQVSGLLEVA